MKNTLTGPAQYLPGMDLSAPEVQLENKENCEGTVCPGRRGPHESLSKHEVLEMPACCSVPKPLCRHTCSVKCEGQTKKRG